MFLNFKCTIKTGLKDLLLSFILTLIESLLEGVPLTCIQVGEEK